MALAGRLRAHGQGHNAVGTDGHLGVLRWRAAGILDVIRQADATEPAVPPGLLATSIESLPHRDFEREIHIPLERAAVIGGATQRGIRHVRHRDEVSSAKRYPLYASFRRRGVDQALEYVGCFCAAYPTQGIERHGVCDDAAEFEVHCAEVVGPGDDRRHVHDDRVDAAARNVGTDVHIARNTEAEKSTILVKGEFAADDLISCL